MSVVIVMKINLPKVTRLVLPRLHLMLRCNLNRIVLLLFLTLLATIIPISQALASTTNVDYTRTLTTSGNEITDAVRTTNTQGDGLTPPDSSYCIWQSTTNLNTNGGLETNTTGWTASSKSSLARSTEQAKFGTASCKGTVTLTATGNFGLCNYLTTLTAAVHYASAWVYVPSSWTGSQIV